MNRKNAMVQRLQDQYLSLVAKHPEFRVGQALFNALRIEFPMIADTIVGTEFDPFYTEDPEHIEKCWGHLYKVLSD